MITLLTRNISERFEIYILVFITLWIINTAIKYYKFAQFERKIYNLIDKNYEINKEKN